MHKGIYFLLLILIVLLLFFAGYVLFVSFTSNQTTAPPQPPQPAITQGQNNPEAIATATATATATSVPLLQTVSTDTPDAVEAATATATVIPAPPTPMALSDMVLIPAGEFIQGADDGQSKDSPSQVVNLPVYEIDKYEVTNRDFALFVASTGYVTDAEQSSDQGWRQYGDRKPNHPVVKVTWNDAAAFCAWAGKRLPTEAEWEKAARGTDARIYPWGNIFDANLANVKDTGNRSTQPIGQFSGGGSPYGVQDMGGNVWEWTASWFLPYPGNAEPNPDFGERFRVTRGGAWFEEADQVTTYNRNAADPEITANDDVGFRCVRDVQ